jgi:Flp pilus assembly protein TadD
MKFVAPPTVALSAALVVLTGLAFGQSAFGDFVNFDDYTYIVQNPIVRQGLTLEGVQWAFSTTYFGNWHPVTWLSLMLDCTLFGAQPGLHHLMSVGLHAATSVLVFLLINTLSSRRWLSFLAAAFFAIHPLRVESVAWASSRKDLLCGLFFVAACLAYSRARRVGLAVFVLGALSMLSKAMGVTLPLVLVLLDVALGRTGSTRWPRLFIEKSALGLVSLLTASMTILAQGEGGNIVSLERASFVVRLCNAAVNAVDYLRLTAWPLHAIPFYPYVPRSLAAGLMAGLAIALITILALSRWRAGARLPAVGWCWYLVTLAPIIGLIQTGEQAIADRYTYIPHMGLFLSCVSWAGVPGSRLERVGAALGVGGLVVCLWLSFNQTVHWRTDETLFARILSVSPDNEAGHSGLASLALRSGRPAEAERHLRIVVKQNPRHAMALPNLAAAVLSQGRIEESLQLYEKALELTPDSLPLRLAAARAFVAANKFDQALILTESVVQTAPGFGLGLFRHGLVLGELGRHREAHAALERALALEPSNPEYAMAVAFALMKSGRPDEAEALFGQLASLPGFEAARRERDQLRSRRLVKMAPDGGP